MRISIVIDNYNYANYVAQAIESALAQTHADVEVVVVDDGSTDASMEVIRRYADRVQVVQQPNGGQGAAYNAGFARATGEVMIFLDADDWLYPNAASEVAAAWRAGVSKVQFRLDMVDKGGASLGRQLPRDLHDDNARELMCEFGAYGSPPGSGNAFHVDFLLKVLPMDAAAWRIAADSVPILLAPAYGAVVSVAHALGAYRLHRPMSDGALVFNNSPSGLAAEYQRIIDGKRMVEAGLRRAGMAHREPLAWAPWEARTLALCMRFGGPEMAAQWDGSAASPLRFMVASLWRWPATSLRRRVLLSAWVVAVCWLPLPMARRVAQLHRQSAGVVSG